MLQVGLLLAVCHGYMHTFYSCSNMPTDLLQQYQLQLVINENI